MATRVRQPTATPGPSSRASNATSMAAAADLPSYQKPTFALNAAGQRAMANLLRQHDTKRLGKGVEDAQNALTESATDLFDKLYKRQKSVASSQKRRRDNGEDDDNEFAENLQKDLDQNREKAQGMAERMETEMRRLIDTTQTMQYMTAAVTAAENDARLNASTQATAQSTRTTQRSRRAAANGEEDEDDENEEYADFTPTDPAGGTQPQRGATEVFLKHLENNKTKYQGYSLTDRYAQNNAYRVWKRSVHDAQYPEDEVELPPENKWFNADGTVPAPGVAGGNIGEDGDDDIAIERSRTSTKCPLTLKELEEPLKSKKCPHVFEKEAIYEMIQRSAGRFVQCPVPGCSQQLTRNDLEVDVVLIRRIQRIQRAQRLAEEEGSDDDEPTGTQRRGHVIDDDDDGVDIDAIDSDEEPVVRLKSEPRPTGASAPRPFQAAPPPSQAIDLGDSDEDDDDEEMED